MMKYVIIILFFSLFIVGCSGNAQTNGTTGNTALEGEVEKIEIIHFHGTDQCYSCIMVGSLAEETVKVYFAEEVKSGKVSFAHINGELPEHSALVKKYGATGSSIWIGTYYVDGEFKAEQNTNVWYKINNPTDYMTYLSGVINDKLGVSA